MKLAIGYPAYREQVHIGHTFQAAQMASLWAGLKQQPPNMIYVDSAFIDKARNLLIAQALTMRCDWILQCDADTYYTNPVHIARMLADGEARRAAVIGAAVRMRKREAELFNVAHAPAFEPLTREQLGTETVIEVDRIGGAFTAINLGWLRDHWQDSPWFMVQHAEGPMPKTVGEDCWFSDGVRRRGGIILVDPRFEPVHVGAGANETAACMSMGVIRADV